MADKQGTKQQAAEEKLISEAKSVLAFLMAKSNGVRESGTAHLNQTAAKPEPSELSGNPSLGVKGAQPLFIWAEDNDTALQVKTSYNDELEFIKKQRPGRYASSSGEITYSTSRDMLGRKVVEVEARGEVDGRSTVTRTVHSLSPGGSLSVENSTFTPETGESFTTRESYEPRTEQGMTHTIQMIKPGEAEPILLLEDLIRPDGSTTTYTAEHGTKNLPAKSGNPVFANAAACLRAIQNLKEVINHA